MRRMIEDPDVPRARLVATTKALWKISTRLAAEVESLTADLDEARAQAWAKSTPSSAADGPAGSDGHSGTPETGKARRTPECDFSDLAIIAWLRSLGLKPEWTSSRAIRLERHHDGTCTLWALWYTPDQDGRRALDHHGEVLTSWPQSTYSPTLPPEPWLSRWSAPGAALSADPGPNAEMPPAVDGASGAESDAGAPALLWVDVETTGLDPSRDAILEIAVLVTDSRGREIGDPLHAVIKHDPEDVARMRATCPEAVRSMHDASGLWSLLPEGEPLHEIAARLTATIAAHGPPRTLRIAGSSVRLDAAFIERYAPTAAALLHYRIVDVSSLAFVAREMGWVEGAFPKGSAHRALADIRESLAEYRWLCGLIGRHKSTSADPVAGVEMPPADADDDAEWEAREAIERARGGR